MKNSNNLNRVLEAFWLIVALFTLFMGTYIWIRNSWDASYMFLIMSGLSFLLYLARKGLRRKQEKEQS